MFPQFSSFILGKNQKYVSDSRLNSYRRQILNCSRVYLVENYFLLIDT